ncbi:hypothetical protein Hanom_Chr04g00357041 [Helianthus anomalus]
MQGSGSSEPEEVQGSGIEGAAANPHLVDGSKSHAIPNPVHGEKASAANLNDEEREVNLEVGLGCRLNVNVVGPDSGGVFTSGAGNKVSRPKRRPVVGHRGQKAHSLSPQIISPEGSRPKKRTREFLEDNSPGFGFVGFRANLNTPIDLNSRAVSSEAQMGDTTQPEVQNDQSDRVSSGQDCELNKEVENIINIGTKVGV